MLWLIVGIALGIGLLLGVQHSRREEVTVPGYAWALGAVAVIMVLLGIEVFAGSLAESEARAAWLGLLAFAVPGVALGALAWWSVARGASERGDAGARSEDRERVSA